MAGEKSDKETSNKVVYPNLPELGKELREQSLKDIENLLDDIRTKTGVLFPTICLCGSTKYKEKFIELNQILTLLGAIVLMPGVYAHYDDVASKMTDDTKTWLDIMHKRKIDISDAIMVVTDINEQLTEQEYTSETYQNACMETVPYVGSSTFSEIEYANNKEFPVFFVQMV